MSNATPERRRRSAKYQNAEGKAPLRPVRSAPPEEEAPLPLGSESRPFPQQPARREAPLVYDEADYPPLPPLSDGMYDADDGWDDEDGEPPRRWPLFAALGVLALLALLAALYFFGPKDNSGALGFVRKPVSLFAENVLGIRGEETPKLIKFETAEPFGTTGTRIVFTFTSDIAVDDVRLQDENGTVIGSTTSVKDAPANTLWTASVTFDEPFDGPIYASIFKNGKWYFEGKSIMLGIAEPTPAPTPAPTPMPTEAPTQALVAEPAATVPPTPELLATYTPTPAATAAPRSEAAPIGAQAALHTAPPFIPPVIILPEAIPDAPEGTAGDTGDMPEDIPEEEGAEGLPEDIPEEEGAEEWPEDAAGTAETAGLSPAETASRDTENTGSAAPAAQMALPALTAEADESAAPKKLSIADTAYLNGKKQAEFKREDAISFPAPDQYTSYAGGVFTFRGDSFRRNAAFGDADISLKQLSVLWESDMGSLNTSSGRLSGMGWTGQPAIVKWSKELRQAMNISEEKKAVSPLKEVIFASQDGKVYFLDLNDGKPTRDAISIGFPLKGSVAVDPQGQPVIAFGQGVSKLSNKTGDIGLYVYNLLDQKRLTFINGRKSNKQSQFSTNGAFDGTALFDRTSDTMVVGGENGLLYTVKLNTKFDFQDPANMTLTASPEISYLKSKGKQQDSSVSLEGSAAAYNGYAFVADKQGYLRCVDLNTLSTVWARDMGDNTDATPALDLNADQSLSLYTGTTVFSRTKGKKTAVIRSMDAMSGRENWQYTVPALFNKDERAGVKASPVVGEKNISDIVVFTVSNVQEGGSVVVALDKQSGQEVWKTPLTANTVSSPVAVYDKSGNAFIIQGDESGTLSMLDGRTGEVLHTLDLGGKIDASPAVYNDLLVIGTCGSKPKMFGIRIE